MIENQYIKTKFTELYKVICCNFVENYHNIIKLLNRKKTDNKHLTTTLYKMDVFIDYKNIEVKMNKLYQTLSNNYIKP